MPEHCTTAHPCHVVFRFLLQVFGVFNTLLGAVVKNSRIEFDDDWEEKSDIAATGKRLLQCVFSLKDLLVS